LNVCPSIFEGFGLSAVEGMAKSCPPLSHDSIVFREVIGDAGFFVNMKNPQAIAKTLMELIGDSKVIEEKKSIALEVSKKYTWPKAVNRLLELYLH